MGNGYRVTYFIAPTEVAQCILVGMVNDTYRELSTKNNTQNMRRATHENNYRRIWTTNVSWCEMEQILENAKNKEELINIVRFMQSDKGRQLMKVPFIITVGNKIYRF